MAIILDRGLANGTPGMVLAATKRKVYLGKVTNYFRKLNVAEIKLENGDLEKGDSIIITGPSTGVIEYTADEIRVDLKETAKALKGEFCSIKMPSLLRRSDKVYKWVEATETGRINIIVLHHVYLFCSFKNFPGICFNIIRIRIYIINILLRFSFQPV